MSTTTRPGRFPHTRGSLILAARSGDADTQRQAFDSLVRTYWRPVYKYLRVKWRSAPEDAEDLTQGFFAQALEKGFFQRYDPAKARFRTWLRVCLDAFASNQHKAGRRLKRGGGVLPLRLDFEGAEGELLHHEVADGLDLEEYFHREWVRNLFALAVEGLRQLCASRDKEICFALFERYDLEAPAAPDKPTYADLAREFELPVTQVTNHLAFARREFRRLVMELLREITGSEEEFHSEARLLLGVEPS